jgi:methionyl-tRNA synthetase
MTTRFYVTTPIYYVNDSPHLGTAYTTIAADALRRYHQLRGNETRMLTGTDEHGLKIEREAKERKTTPQTFVDEMSGRFRDIWPKLGIEHDDFIRTTEVRHTKLVQDIWKQVEKNGDLYLGHYEDWYCVACESYKTEKELLPGNFCALHPNRMVEKVKEETYFFRLSKYEKPLLEHYAQHPTFVEPATRRNEVISFVQGGLRDLSVSRTSFQWGVPVPGNPRHVMYVWFDALANYLTALGPPNDPLRRFWPPDGRVVHLVGKDILRFHAVYWPAFLLAAGFTVEQLPSQVFAHGFLTVDGQKMSKSLRNSVDPLRLATELGVDALRYHLLRAIAFGQDGDFDHAALFERYNADLGKNLGNLLSRVLGLCAKMTESKTPAQGEILPLDAELLRALERGAEAARVAWGDIEPHRALEATWAIASAANQYVDRAAPWAEAKKPGGEARVGTILSTLLTVLEGLSVMIWPAMPTKANELRAQLGLGPMVPTIGLDSWPRPTEPRAAGEALRVGTPLFPMLDDETVRALLDKLAPKPVAPQTLPPTPRSPESRVSPTMPAAGVTATTTPTTPITYEQFAAIDLRVGIIRQAERVPKKDKLLRLEVDLGDATPRQIIAGLALTFRPEDLLGKRVVVVANLAPREFGKGLVSHGMILATGATEALELATVPPGVAAGARIK